MPLSKIFLVPLLALGSLAAARYGSEQPRTSGTHIPLTCEKQTESYLNALVKRDFRILYEAAFECQDSVKALKEKYPQNMCNQVLEQHYNSSEKRFLIDKDEMHNPDAVFEAELLAPLQRLAGADTSADYGCPPGRKLQPLLVFSPEWRILESRPGAQIELEEHPQYTGRSQLVSGVRVFVLLSFPSADHAPVGGGFFVAKWQYEFQFSTPGCKLVRIVPVPRSVEFREGINPKILGVKCHRLDYGGNAMLDFRVAGADSSSRLSLSCDQKDVPLNILEPTNFVTGIVRARTVGAKFRQGRRLRCNAVIVGGEGKTDRVSFEVPRPDIGLADLLCWERCGWWSQNLVWEPTCRKPMRK